MMSDNFEKDKTEFIEQLAQLNLSSQTHLENMIETYEMSDLDRAQFKRAVLPRTDMPLK
jgi:hypothetical protein